MAARIVRASEISAYLFCRRAWWLQQQGIESENALELASGNELHERHGRQVLWSGCLRSLAYAALLAALALFTVYCMKMLLPGHP